MLGNRFRCYGFDFYVANEDISVAINTFQLPECSRHKLSCLFEFHCHLSQQDVWCRDRWGTIQEKAEKKLPLMKKLLYTAADLMFPCSQKMFGVCAEQFPVQAAEGQWMSQATSVQFFSMEWMEQAVAPLHLHLGKCTVNTHSGLLCRPSSCPSLSLLCVMGSSGCTSELFLKLCYILKLM